MTLETTGVHILFRDLYLERPPKVRLYMDVWLDNAPDQPRWFLLPDEVSGEREGPVRRISSLQVYELRDNGRAWVGHFYGEGGFQALLLPPGAHVVLRGFPVLYWGEIPDAADLEVIAAETLTVGEKPAASWFGIDPTCDRRTCDRRADVSAEPLATQKDVCIARRLDVAQPVEWGGERRFAIHLAIQARRPR